jgi:hypothetical protein
MTRTQELEREIRGFINAPRKQGLLLKDRAKWAKLCSSLDVIGDAELALESYLGRKTPPADTGELYILMYGVLQVLYAQQDAVKHLNESLGLPYARTAALTAVRTTRNEAVGHPTSSGYGKAFNFISRITLCEGGFEMMTLGADGSHQTRHINMPDQIAQQRAEVGSALLATLSALREEETLHRRQFRGTALASLLPSAVADNIGGTAADGQTLESVDEHVARLRSELEKRDLLSKHSSALHLLAEIENSATQLRGLFSQTPSSVASDEATEVRLALASKLRGFMGLASEVDADYASDA